MSAKRFQFITAPDNFVQVIFRMLSAIIVRQLAKTPVTPNQVTIVRGIVVTGALALFAAGDPHKWIVAVALFYVFEILDHVDGDLARATQRFSSRGPLLEQFIDTWSARSSNLFGFSIALGMYNNSADLAGIYLFALTAFGRMQWLEYRHDFGWVKLQKGSDENRHSILRSESLPNAIRSLFVILYTWNNSFLLLAALFYIPLKPWLRIDPLILGFLVVAILNNIPWIVIVARGFVSPPDMRRR